MGAGVPVGAGAPADPCDEVCSAAVPPSGRRRLNRPDQNRCCQAFWRSAEQTAPPAIHPSVTAQSPGPEHSAAYRALGCLMTLVMSVVENNTNKEPTGPGFSVHVGGLSGCGEWG